MNLSNVHFIAGYFYAFKFLPHHPAG